MPWPTLLTDRLTPAREKGLEMVIFDGEDHLREEECNGQTSLSTVPDRLEIQGARVQILVWSFIFSPNLLQIFEHWGTLMNKFSKQTSEANMCMSDTNLYSIYWLLPSC